MLACLPGPGDLSLPLPHRTQMTSGPPPRWDTTQRMRSAPFPTPAELDAYAKKVALQPLTIKIFPSSVKVPQRNHVRRTVNGLDTQRYSPYPPAQAGARSGLLLAVAARGHTPKALLKDYDGSRSRSHPEAGMNPPPLTGGPYQGAPPSTLDHPHHHHAPPPQAPLQSLGLGHPPPAAQQHPHPQGTPGPPHPQGHPPPPPYPPAALLLHPPQPRPSSGARKQPQGDAPPNVTVSTSTIPVSMATAPPPPQADLSAIVHQISRFCQARAHAAATSASSSSVYEGRIANPGPISRSLLINACTRASYPQPPELHLHGNPPPGYHSDVKPHPLQLHMPPRPRPWSQPPLAHLQGGGVGFPSCEGLGYHPPEVCVVGRPTPSPPVLLHHNNNNNIHTGGGPCHMTCHMTHYGGGGHYFTPSVWTSSILPTPNSDSSGSQDLGLPFHGAPPPPSSSCSTTTTTGLDCGPPGGVSHYRPGAPPAQTHLMQAPDYLGGDFQTPYLPDANLGLMGPTHRAPGGRVGPGDGEACSLLLQHPGYR